MTILPSSPTVKGFTANNLKVSVRYLRHPLAAACVPDRTRLRGNSLLDGSLVYRFGGWFRSRRARCIARQLARGALADPSD